MMAEDLEQYNDIEGLRLILVGMEKTTPRMRKASLEFAFDKYVRRAPQSDDVKMQSQVFAAIEKADNAR